VSQGDLVIPLLLVIIVAVRFLVMTYTFTDDIQVEEMMNGISDMWEGYDVNDEDWNDFYNEKDYDDSTWTELGGVNADSM